MCIRRGSLHYFHRIYVCYYIKKQMWHLCKAITRHYPVLCDFGRLQFANYVKNRDETIRSSQATIRIDTKVDDMIIYDTIRYDTIRYGFMLFKYNYAHYSYYFIYYHLNDKHNRGKIQLVSFINTLAIRFTKINKKHFL